MAPMVLSGRLTAALESSERGEDWPAVGHLGPTGVCLFAAECV
jgi:hypothetical protein